MKLSLAALSLLSTPAYGYMAASSNFGNPVKQPTSSALGYVKSIDMVEAQATTTNGLAVIEEDAATSDLKKSLGFSESAIREKYSDWLMQYGKVADESRYVTYKKNFLMQEAYNQKVGASFTLNRYGDMTEQEYRAMKSNIAVVEPPEIVEDLPVESTTEAIEKIDDSTELLGLEESKTEEEKDTEKVIIPNNEAIEIANETEMHVEKYASIQDVEERAFEVLKDLNIVKPAPQHFSFSYVDEIPELRLENGSTYMDALHNPKLSAIEGSSPFSTYLSSIPASESGTFEKGKSGKALGASAAYLTVNDICDMLEPFMDCDKQQRTPIQIVSPVEDVIYKGASQIKGLGDKAFQVLLDLCSIGRCDRK